MQIVQIQNRTGQRHVAQVEAERLRIIEGVASLYEIAWAAAERGERLSEKIANSLSQSTLDYEAIYSGADPDWRLLTPFDHPAEPSRCLVSGTGLTHRQSAANRDKMHQANTTGTALTDSMKMYLWGEEGGRPKSGEIGAQPEWFYKGSGTILRAHGEPLDAPDFGDDGGEEAEVAALYLIDQTGTPRRVGFAKGNEFSDHLMEKKNYLYLAPGKLRTCAVGPEIALDASFDDVQGTTRILRGDELVWTHAIATGEAQMTHTLQNLEYHHFKYEAHRRPGDVHVHFFGAGAFSFGAGVALEQGDLMEVDIPALGRPLRNPIRIAFKPAALVTVSQL